VRWRLFGLHAGDVIALISQRDQELQAAVDRVSELEAQALRAARDASDLAIESSRRLARAEAAERRLTSAEGELTELRGSVSVREREIETLRRRSTEQEDELRRLRLELEEVGRAALEREPVEELTYRYLMEEIGPVVRAAEESAARIEEGARARAEAREAELSRLEDDLRDRADAYAEWRRTLEPVLDGIASRIQEMDQRMQQAPGLVAQALLPVAEVMSTMHSDLQRVGGFLVPPEPGVPPETASPDPVTPYVEDTPEPEAEPGGSGVSAFLAHANPWGESDVSSEEPAETEASPSEGIVAVIEEGPESEGSENGSPKPYVIEVEVDSSVSADRPT
jgi:hypothetical protein